MLKAVIDTSVLVSGLINSRSSRQIILALENSLFIPVISPAILEELLDVLARAKFHKNFNRETASRLIETIKSQAIAVTPRMKLNAVPADPNDNCFIEAALASKADCVVSLDNHLLDLKSFNGIPILRPLDFIKRLK